MKKLHVCSWMGAAAMLFSGCETITAGSSAYPAPSAHIEEAPISGEITNTAMARLILKLTNLEGLVDTNNEQAVIRELQKTGNWPAGQYQGADRLTPETFAAIYRKVAQSRGAVNGGNFTLGVAKEVTVRIYDVGDIKDEREITTKVDKRGNLVLPLVRSVHVKGLTPGEAAEKIRQAYVDGGIYRSLTVDVQSSEGDLFIEGEVNEVGKIEYSAGMTLSELIIASGGLTEFADDNRIEINRNRNVTVHDYSKIRSSEAVDPVLQPGDRVNVKRTRW